MKDTFKHKGLRNKLASEVKSKGVLDFRVLNAIESIKASPNTQVNRQIKGAIKNHRKRERKKSKTVL